MGTQFQEKDKLKEEAEEISINFGNLEIQMGKKVEPDYFRELLQKSKALLKEVNSSFSDDIIAERNA